ncbi:hypothetical protein LINGRAHAP2_LOCUS11183 [Linum grandiflorum]
MVIKRSRVVSGTNTFIPSASFVAS